MSKGRPDLVVQTAGGRRLAVDAMGPEDGIPLVICHGEPGARLLPTAIESQVRARGVRMIGIDRPGYGFSDFQPGRTILDWGRDVERVVDALDIDAFYVAGFSAGAVFALACAHVLPERVRGTAMVGAVTQEYSGSLVHDVVAPLGPVGRGLLALPGGWLAAHAALAFGIRKDPQRTLERVRSMVRAESERAFLSGPGGQDVLAAMVEGVRTGARGWAYETALIRRPWGFSPREVAGLVAVWHSIHDETIPIEHARRLADELPAGNLYETEVGGHISVGFLKFSELVDSLLQPSAPALGV